MKSIIPILRGIFLSGFRIGSVTWFRNWTTVEYGSTGNHEMMILAKIHQYRIVAIPFTSIAKAFKISATMNISELLTGLSAHGFDGRQRPSLPGKFSRIFSS